MKIGSVEFNKEMISFMKDNKDLIRAMLENNETREVSFNQENIFSIIDSFFKTNNDAVIIIDNEKFNDYDESYILGVFENKQIVILETRNKKIYLIKVRDKLAIIGEELISAIPWLDC